MVSPLEAIASASPVQDSGRVGGVSLPGTGDPALVSRKDPTEAKAAKAAAGDTVTLSPEAKAQVGKLKARDAEVRAHEAAHLAAGGGVTRGGASFSYTQGPDGRGYATGGEVSVDTSPVAGNPQATVAKANAIRAAALAPASPSPQDLSVAASASLMAAKAAAEASASASRGGGAMTPGRHVDVTA